MSMHSLRLAMNLCIFFLLNFHFMTFYTPLWKLRSRFPVCFTGFLPLQDNWICVNQFYCNNSSYLAAFGHCCIVIGWTNIRQKTEYLFILQLRCSTEIGSWNFLFFSNLLVSHIIFYTRLYRSLFLWIVSH